jgi:hypothetical protein
VEQPKWDQMFFFYGDDRWLFTPSSALVIEYFNALQGRYPPLISETEITVAHPTFSHQITVILEHLKISDQILFWSDNFAGQIFNVISASAFQPVFSV